MRVIGARGRLLAVVLALGAVADSSAVRGDDDLDAPFNELYKRHETVEEITGSYTYRSYRKESSQDKSYEERAEGTFQFELKLQQRESAAAFYTGRGRGQGSYRQVDIATGTKRITEVIQGAGPIGEDQVEVTLNLRFDDGKYYLSVNTGDLGFPVTVTQTCEVIKTWPGDSPCTNTTREDVGGQFSGGGIGPLGATTLSGSAPIANGEVTWQLQLGLADIELIVVPVDYDEWMPEGTTSQTVSGPRPLAVVATLQKRGGGDPPHKATSIRFTLSEVSTLPGLASNYPLDAPTRDPDLAFETDENPALVLATPVSAEARSQGPPHVTATAKVSAFDFGGYGTLTVEAFLENGGVVVGHLAGRNDRSVLIPRRAPGSRIAERWMNEQAVTGQDDTWDEETKPEADPGLGGHHGDGLTLFEEYRGFVIGDEHVRGEALRKEMFVVDTLGGDVKLGIEMFAGLTGLRVYHELRTTPPLEAKAVLEDSKVAGYIVNFNNGDDLGEPGGVDKQAIGVVLWCPTRLLPGAPAAAGSPGRPCVEGDFAFADYTMGAPRMVTIPFATSQQSWTRVRRGQEQLTTNDSASVVAHELAHAASVNHHGDRDPESVTWNYDGRDWFETRGSAAPVRINIERSSGDFDPLWLSQRGKLHIGVMHGQHCGVEDCIMRYDVAVAHVPGGRPDVRVLDPPQGRGVELCTSRVGTGVNGEPWFRFGDAVDGAPNVLGAESHGNCAPQVCVNDRIPHP